MYGKTHNEEAREKIRQANIGKHIGSDNLQFGVSPKERMNAETYENWINKHKQITGHKNPNAHKVLMINIETHEQQLFEATVECASYLLTIKQFAERYDTIEKLRYVIKHSNKTKAIYFNYIFIINSTNEGNTVSSINGRVIRKIPKYSRP